MEQERRFRISYKGKLLRYVFAEKSHATAMCARLTLDHIKGINPNCPDTAETWKNASWKERCQMAEGTEALYTVIEETLDLPVSYIS